MALEDEAENPSESTSSAAKTADRADKAIRNTADRYLKRFRMNLDLEQVERWIREKPLSSAGIAAAAGFIVGGGLVTRPGVAILAVLGRSAARDSVRNL